MQIHTKKTQGELRNKKLEHCTLHSQIFLTCIQAIIDQHNDLNNSPCHIFPCFINFSLLYESLLEIYCRVVLLLFMLIFLSNQPTSVFHFVLFLKKISFHQEKVRPKSVLQLVFHEVSVQL